MIAAESIRRVEVNAFPAPPTPATDGGRSVGELFGELATEIGTLVRKETQLAAKELGDKAVYAGKQAGLIAVGAVLGVVAAGVLVAALVLLLAVVMPAWVAALVVGIVVSAAAAIFAAKGIAALRTMDPRPWQTMVSIEETKSWMYEQVR